MDKFENKQKIIVNVKKEQVHTEKEIITFVYNALEEKGYNPISQLVGYILSGDPSYITSHKNARSMIRHVERDDLLEELFTSYIKHNKVE